VNFTVLPRQSAVGAEMRRSGIFLRYLGRNVLVFNARKIDAVGDRLPGVAVANRHGQAQNPATADICHYSDWHNYQSTGFRLYRPL